MHYDGEDMSGEFRRMFNESAPSLVDEIFHEIGNPVRTMEKVAVKVNLVVQQLE